MNRTEETLTRALRETAMPDDVRRALVDRLARDLDDRGNFSQTGFRLACTPLGDVSYNAPQQPAAPPQPASTDAYWLGYVAMSLARYVRGRAPESELKQALSALLASPLVKGDPAFRRALLKKD